MAVISGHLSFSLSSSSASSHRFHSAPRGKRPLTQACEPGASDRGRRKGSGGPGLPLPARSSSDSGHKAGAEHHRPKLSLFLFPVLFAYLPRESRLSRRVPPDPSPNPTNRVSTPLPRPVRVRTYMTPCPQPPRFSPSSCPGPKAPYLRASLP